MSLNPPLPQDPLPYTVELLQPGQISSQHYCSYYYLNDGYRFILVAVILLYIFNPQQPRKCFDFLIVVFAIMSITALAI